MTVSFGNKAVKQQKLPSSKWNKPATQIPLSTAPQRKSNVPKVKSHPTESVRTAKEGSGDVRKTTPMPERLQQHRKKMALVKPTGSNYARASVQVTRKWRIWRRSFYCWPLIKYFVWNTILWEPMCEVNPQAMASHWQKWWNIGETWNCIHLRFRSVYLGLASTNHVCGIPPPDTWTKNCENHARKMRTFFTRRLEPKTRSSYHIKWSNAKWNTLKQNTSSLLKTKLS